MQFSELLKNAATKTGMGPRRWSPKRYPPGVIPGGPLPPRDTAEVRRSQVREEDAPYGGESS